MFKQQDKLSCHTSCFENMIVCAFHDFAQEVSISNIVRTNKLLLAAIYTVLGCENDVQANLRQIREP